MNRNCIYLEMNQSHVTTDGLRQQNMTSPTANNDNNCNSNNQTATKNNNQQQPRPLRTWLNLLPSVRWVSRCFLAGQEFSAIGWGARTTLKRDSISCLALMRMLYYQSYGMIYGPLTSLRPSSIRMSTTNQTSISWACFFFGIMPKVGPSKHFSGHTRGKTSKRRTRKIAALKALKVMFPDRFTDEGSMIGLTESFGISLDGVDLKKPETRQHPTEPYDPKECSHKMKHAAWQYEIGLAIFEDTCIHINGPKKQNKTRLESLTNQAVWETRWQKLHLVCFFLILLHFFGSLGSSTISLTDPNHY